MKGFGGMKRFLICPPGLWSPILTPFLSFSTATAPLCARQGSRKRRTILGKESLFIQPVYDSLQNSSNHNVGHDSIYCLMTFLWLKGKKE